MPISVHSVKIVSPTFLHAVSYLRVAKTRHPKSDLINVVNINKTPVCDLQFGHIVETSYITYAWLYTPHKNLNVVRLDKCKGWNILGKYIRKFMCKDLGILHVQWEGL